MRTELADARAAQLRLLTWFSPAFPVGGFGYSHGLETAIREDHVEDATALQDWIMGLLEHGSGWTDAVLFRLTWGEPERLAEHAELAEALAPSLERRKETLALGAAFAQAVKPWLVPSTASRSPSPRGGGESRLRRSSTPPQGEGDREAVEGTALPYPVAAGSACAAAGIPLEPALTAYLHAFAASLVSVGVRAIPIGQSEAVGALAGLEDVILATAARASVATEDDLGACAILSDIAAMRHETLQPRLFIS